MGEKLDRMKAFGANYYIDTRGRAKKPVPFTEAVINGLAEGGGLYVPEEIPTLSLEEILALADLPYAQRAASIYKTFNIDLPDKTIDALMKKSYSDNFDTSEICPITSLNDSTHILELWHGPTSAFKDMALQCLPHFFSECVAQLHARGKAEPNYLILVATSGDTGKAALAGFKDVNRVRVGVLYPDGGTSDIQRKQMVTQTGSNVHVWAVTGNFDDCQTAVKHTFSDESFAASLREEFGFALSSANSINWGRLMPQIVYYLSGYAELVKQGKVEAGSPIDVCVPTGNFGNILAAFYAKRMGAPIATLICASNANSVLSDFINTGTYSIVRRDLVLTAAPSMDILVSSNLERLLFELTDRNPEAIRNWMLDLNENLNFRIDNETYLGVREHFSSQSADDITCLSTIRNVFARYNYLLDPHTAVGFHVAQSIRGTNPLLVVSTAHWAKFGNNVYRALHHLDPHEPLPDEIASLTGCQLNRLIADETGHHDIPEGLAVLDELPIRFKEVIGNSVSEVETAVDLFLRL